VRVTRLGELEASTPVEVLVPPNSRTTIPVTAAGATPHFGVLIESTGASPVPVVVEGAFYWSADGVLWSAGSNIVATRLP
jgi:hypothetical protein